MGLLRHIKYLNIKSFRGLKNVNLDNLKTLNLFVGENNTGKTSILEIIDFLENPGIIGNYIRVSRSREILFHPLNGRLTPYESFINMFDKRDGHKKISFDTNIYNKEISIILEGKEERIIKINDKENDKDRETLFDRDEEIADEEVLSFKGNLVFENYPDKEEQVFTLDEDESRIGYGSNRHDDFIDIRYISPMDHLAQNSIISRVIKSGNKNEVIELLKIFDKKIKGLEIIENRRRPVPYIDHEELGMIPLSTFGDGIKKALLIASNIVTVKGGVLLIDEIETSIHKIALEKFFKWFIDSCNKYNVQTFIATHSLEAIDAIINSCENFLEDIVCYRLENNNGEIFSNRFSGEKLQKIRYNLGQDVR